MIQTEESYNTECLCLLGDRRNHEILAPDPTETLEIEISTYVEEAVSNGWICQKEATFLCRQKSMAPYFYTLPKVHKVTRPPPGQPIVSGIDSVLEPLSQFCDFFLRPIVQRMPAYLKDTREVLNLINNMDFDPDREILIGLDIESLYTNIPQLETLRVIENILFAEEWEYQTPRSVVLCLAELALTRNFFQYKDTIYLQCHGTSMGSSFAPSLASPYVSHFENENVYSETNPFLDHIRVWKRYIDDVLLIWRGDRTTAERFLT